MSEDIASIVPQVCQKTTTGGKYKSEEKSPPEADAPVAQDKKLERR
jgi:hypothetical protein